MVLALFSKSAKKTTMGICSVFHALVKYLLFTLNLIFTIIGLGLAIAAIVLYIQFKTKVTKILVEYNLEQAYQSLAIALVVFGMIIFFIALSGCWGSVFENQCLLVTYAVIMCLLVAPKVFLAVKYDDYTNILQNKSEEKIKSTFNYKDQSKTIPFHVLEVMLQCCGTTGPISYSTVFPPPYLPPTCCDEKPTSFNQLVDLVEKYKDSQKAYKDLASLQSGSSFAGLAPSLGSHLNVTDSDLNSIQKLAKELNTQCNIMTAAQDGCLETVHDNIGYYMKKSKYILIGVIAFEVFELIAAIYLYLAVKPPNEKNGYY